MSEEAREFHDPVMECPDCEDGVLTMVDTHRYPEAIVNISQCNCGFEAEETFKHDMTLEVTHSDQ